MQQNIKNRIGKNSVLDAIWFFIKPYKLQIIILMALFFLVGALEAASIAAVYPILNIAFAPDAEQSNYILSLFGRMAGLLPIEDEFISYIVLFMITAILAFAVKLISVIYRIRFAAALVRKNQTDIFNKLIFADYQYYINHKQGELIYNTITAPEKLSALMFGVTEFISQILLSISVLLLLFSLSWQGALAILILGVGYQYLSRYMGKKVSYQAAKHEMEAGRDSNVVLNEAISGIKQIKVFVMGGDWADKFSKAVRKRWYYFVRRAVWSQTPPVVLILVMYLAIGIVALLIKLSVPGSFMELIPVFGAFALAVFRLIPFVITIGGTTMTIMAALPDCEIVSTIQREKLSFIEDGEKELCSFKSDIRFENVSFNYQGRKGTIEDISVTFEKGETTAIVGRSGSGKTTMINLLLRLFEVDRGEIKIDGVNIKEYKLSSLLNNIGYVSQDTFILNDTIRNNITFGFNRYSSEEVIKAARYADAYEFIVELPDGFDTLVGDKGMRLSGGQAQRIAVARAMIREPEILIFDEATNNLDNISELAVQRAIEEISKNHTVIIIAHRLSTIVNTDKILVLANKHVIEQGTHKELLDKKGAYWELYQSQPV
ncbi:ABC transporter ATP-binding protein [Chloroflexota bacterium]